MGDSRIKVFRLNNLTGGINTTAEENALLTFDNGSGVQAEARDIENFMPLNRGGQTKTYGFTLYQAVGANPITGLYRFIQSGGTSLFLVTSGTNLYKLVLGTLTSLYTSLANNTYTHFETALDKCVICDGVNVPQVYDGTTVSALGGTPPTGAQQSLFYQNRLWIFGGSANPSLVYYSSPNDITNGYSTQFVQCDVNDGQKITAIGKFFIPDSLEPVIMVGKERSVGIITGDGSTGNPYTFSKISFDAGVPGFRQMVQVGQSFAYLTPMGVSTYSTFINQVKLFYQYLSEKVRGAFQSMNPLVLADALCWYDWQNSRMSYALAESANSYPNVIWHYDVRLNCWYKERYGNGQNITAAFVDTDGSWYHGDSQGNIYLHGSAYNSFNGTAINAYYTTPYLDFGNPFVQKRILDARITLRTQGNYGLGISTRLDYGQRQGKSNTVMIDGAKYTWNGGDWTNDPMVYQWAAAPVKIKRFIPSGLFRSIQLTLTQAGLNEPLDLFELEFLVEFEEFR